VPAYERQPAAGALTVLHDGEIELEGRMPWSSNSTFLAVARLGDVECRAIYKPFRGERPLWDFPDGLFRREVAAYELSEALGWRLVPETVLREDAPYGPGSVQRFIDAEFEQHYFTLLEDESTHDQLRSMCVFDLLANNADRKSGHCLLDADGHIWGIDHGLCFHPDPKLRTVMWDFCGEPIPRRLRADAERLACELPEPLTELLAPEEATALMRRAELVSRLEQFPDPGPGRPYPWPLV
jgi:uncharacterized repeat protein (TIGR03843 family)